MTRTGFENLQRPRRPRSAFRAGRWTGWVLLAALAAVPLAIAPGVFLYYDVTPKIVLLCFGAALVLLFSRGFLPGLRELAGRRFGRLFLVLVALHVVSLGVSTWFSQQPGLSYAGSNWRRMGLVTELALVVLMLAAMGWLRWNPSRLNRLLRVVCVAGSVSALYGILQYFGVDPLLAPEAYHAGEGEGRLVRPPGTVGQAGYFATYLLSPGFLAGALYITDLSARWRWVAAASGLLCAVAVVLSGTRSALAGLAAGAALAGCWYRPRLNRFAAAGAVVAMLAAAAFYVSPAGQKMRSRVQWMLGDPAGGGRFTVWSDSLRLGAQHWKTGAGLETFSSAYPRFQSPELAATYPSRYFESPHNVLVDALAARGLPGLLLLGFFALLAFEAARRLRGRLPVSGWIAASLAASWVSHQFLPFLAPTALYFYVTIGVLVALSTADAPATGGIVTVRPQARPLRPLWAAAPLALWFAAYGAQLGLAGRGLRDVQQRFAGNQIGGALEAYERVRKVQPRGMSADLWFSRQAAAAIADARGEQEAVRVWEAALSAAERATRDAEDRQNAWYNLAAFYAEAEDPAKVEQALRSAIELAPSWYKPRWMLARLLWLGGREQEAEQEAKQAAKLSGGSEPSVLQTYESIRRGEPVSVQP